MDSINDPVHGTINLSSEESRTVEHPMFQRLRKIKALGFLEFVFPSARHSRFEHSIGACHVAGELLDGLVRVSRQLIDKKWSGMSLHNAGSKATLEAISSPVVRESVRLAALLHDCGHGPFSHASECLMPDADSLIKVNNPPRFLADALKAKAEKRFKKNGNSKADHEDYTILIGWKILESLGLSKEKIQFVCAIKDTNVEMPEAYREFSGIREVLHQLVDGEFDSDRMDYLRRDSLFCGVPYGNFDFDRLVEGLCILEQGGKKLIGIRRGSISALEHFLFARFQMHVQVYTHRIDGSCNEMFKNAARHSGYALPASIAEYVELHDENLFQKVSALKELGVMLTNRKLWRMVFESYVEDDAIDSSIMSGVAESVGTGKSEIYRSERPIKKPSLLELPVVGKNLVGELATSSLKAISQLVDRYNATYVVKRVFVHPDYEETARTFMRSIANPASLPGQEELQKAAEAFTEASRSISDESKTGSGS